MSSIVKSGYLKKQGPKANSALKQRYVVLHTDSLKYYKKLNDQNPAGIIQLDDYTSIDKALSIKNARSAFTVKSRLSTTGNKAYRDRSYYFATESDDETKEWIEAIESVIQKSNTKSPVVKSALASSNPPSTSTPATAEVVKPKTDKPGPMMRPDLTILVCCATGNIGRLLCQRLEAKGVHVKAATRYPADNTAMATKNIEVVELDYSNPDTIDKALNDVDKVFFVQAFCESLLDDGKKLVEHIKKHTSIQHIVKVSPIGMDICNYTLAKWHQELEKLIRETRLGFTFVRPNNFFQSLAINYADSIKSTGTFQAPYGESQVSYVDLRDIANLCAEVLTRDEFRGRVIDITGPQALSHHQIAEIISNHLHRRVQYQDIAYDKYREIMKEKGIPGVCVELLIGQYQFSYKANIASKCGPEVEEITGSKPISFEQWIQNSLQEFEKKQLVLITGATTSVGRALIDRLSTETGVVIRARSLDSNLIEFSFSKPESIERALNGIEKVFLFNSFGPSMFDEGKRFLDFIKRAPNVKHIIKVSAVGIDNANCTIAKMHLDLEKLIKESGIGWTIVRANSLHQNVGNLFSNSIRNSDSFQFPVGNSRIASVDARDVANAAAEAILHDELKGMTINANGPESLNHYDIADVISKVTKRNVSFVDITTQEFVANMKGLNVPEKMIDCLVDFYQEGFKKGTMETVTYDIKQVVGSAPITFEEYVHDYIYDFASTTTVLVVGSTGNIGMRVVESLLRKFAVNVHAATRNPESKKSGILKNLGAHLVEFNYSQPETMQAALQNVDKVFWVQTAQAQMIDEAKRFLQCVQEAENVKYIARISALGIDSGNFTLAKWHLEVERMVKAIGVPYTILRCSPLSYNFVSFFSNSIKAGSFAAPFGDSAIAYLDIRDLGEVAAEVLTQDKVFNEKTLDLTGSEALTHDQIAALLSTVAGKTVQYQELEDDAYTAIFLKFGYTRAAIECNLGYYREAFRSGLLSRVSHVVEDILGRRAKRFEEFCSDFRAAFHPAPKFVIAVTGASGTVGTCVVQSLMARRLMPGDYEVRALVRDAKLGTDLEATGARVIEINPNRLANALNGVHRLVLIPPNSDDMANIEKLWLQGCKRQNINFVVRYGAMGSNRRNTSIAILNADGEANLKSSGIPYALVRSSMLMNSFLGQMESLQENGKFYHKLGEGRVSFVDARDIGDAIAAVVSSPDAQLFHQKEFNITGPEAISCTQVSRAFALAFQKPIKYVDMEDDVLSTKKWKEFGLGDSMASGLNFLCDLLRKGYGDFTLNTFEKLTGKPGRTFEQFARYIVALLNEEEDD